jgi:hypothetical protein
VPFGTFTLLSGRRPSRLAYQVDTNTRRRDLARVLGETRRDTISGPLSRVARCRAAVRVPDRADTARRRRRLTPPVALPLGRGASRSGLAVQCITEIGVQYVIDARIIRAIT